MIMKKIHAKGDIPNIEGFEFVAVMPDLTIIEDKVFIKNGIHKCTNFKTMIGWLHYWELYLKE